MHNKLLGIKRIEKLGCISIVRDAQILFLEIGEVLEIVEGIGFIKYNKMVDSDKLFM